jgi:hypothetical protein
MTGFVHVHNSGFIKFAVTVPLSKEKSSKPLFTSNVFYKPHTQSTTAGTVRNARHKLGKT